MTNILIQHLQTGSMSQFAMEFESKLLLPLDGGSPDHSVNHFISLCDKHGITVVGTEAKNLASLIRYTATVYFESESDLSAARLLK